MKHIHLTTQLGRHIRVLSTPFPHVGLGHDGSQFIIPIRGEIAPLTTFTASDGETEIYKGGDLTAFADAASAHAAKTSGERTRQIILDNYGDKPKARRSMRDFFGSMFEGILGGFGIGDDDDRTREPSLLLGKIVNPLPDGTFKLVEHTGAPTGGNGNGLHWVLEPGEDTTDNLLLFIELEEPREGLELLGEPKVLHKVTTDSPSGMGRIVCAIVVMEPGQTLDIQAQRGGGNVRLSWDGNEIKDTRYTGSQFEVFRSIFETKPAEAEPAAV